MTYLNSLSISDLIRQKKINFYMRSLIILISNQQTQKVINKLCSRFQKLIFQFPFYNRTEKFIKSTHNKSINFNEKSIIFIGSRMDKKISFVEQLNNQLKSYQIEKIVLNDQRNDKYYLRQHQNKAKQDLIDLGDLNESTYIQESSLGICSWNKKKDIDIQPQNIITKRNNLLTERSRFLDNRLDPLKSFSTKQIPHLKQLLEKLQTPTNKKKKRPQDRGVFTSAPRIKKDIDLDDRVLVQKFFNNEEQIFQAKGFSTDRKPSIQRPNSMQKKDSENRNPILYPINEVIKEKRRMNEYQKINRKSTNHWNLLKNVTNVNVNELENEKNLLQNLIKNTISNQGSGGKINSQAAQNFLDQYGNLNYFSSNFRNQGKKKGTLTNLLS